MNQTSDLLPILSGAAVAVSLLSIYIANVLWGRTNRPIVTAFITEHDSGTETAVFNLVLSNSGNRPAIRVRMHASRSEILELVEKDTPPERVARIEGCFLPESEVPLLRNGEELTTSFGAYIGGATGGKWLQYGSQIEISITYADIDGRKYESRQPLKVYAREGFGGGVWGERA